VNPWFLHCEIPKIKLRKNLEFYLLFFKNRIGSDEEDNDSDQEESQDSELETAVSRQESNHHKNESPISTESNSNGHEYVLVNRSTCDDIVQENEEKKNDDENEEIDNS
jgi:hypothetical protein